MKSNAISLSELRIGLADEPPAALTLAQLPAVHVVTQRHGPERGAAEQETVVHQILRQEGAERLDHPAAGVEAELALSLRVGDADVGPLVGGAAQHEEHLQVLLLGAAHRRDERGARAEHRGAGGARVRPGGGAEGGQAQTDAARVQHLLGTGALAGLARAGGGVAEAGVALFAALAGGALTEVGHAPAGRGAGRRSEVRCGAYLDSQTFNAMKLQITSS